MRSDVKRARHGDVGRTSARMLIAGTGVIVATMASAPDAVAHLVNVTVWPRYNFANADQALAYGHTLCDEVAAGKSYAQRMGDVKTDFANPDEFQASYLITQAVNELCPLSIWQLRKSAAKYPPPAPLRRDAP